MTDAAVFEHELASACDGRQLPFRIYHPRHASAVTCGAIIAHPYAPLGGSYDDPIVMLVTRQLLSCGVYVGTFNFRGGGSSWTSKPELIDYATFVVFFRQYLASVTESSNSMKLVIGGYSFGSMIASHLNLEQLPQADKAKRQAHFMGRTWTGRRPEENGIAAEGQVSLSFLLVSPLRPPLTWLLNPLAQLSAKQLHFNMTKHPVLVVAGTEDNFTSVDKLRQWAREIGMSATSRLQLVELDGASHFYREVGAVARLSSAICDWISQTLVVNVTDEGEG